MAVATIAFYFPGFGPSAAGEVSNAYAGPMAPEGDPSMIWGQGTPAAFPPFTVVNKGSLYSEVNATDNNPSVWYKVAEAGTAADWIRFGNTGIVTVRSTLYDIDAADSEQVVFHAVTACEILEAGLMWEEATETTGAGTGDITVGTAAAGAEIVAAFSYPLATASGTYTALSLVTGVLAAGTSVFASHDDAGSAIPGTYRLLLKIRVEA